jgi:hypothetical protein
MKKSILKNSKTKKKIKLPKDKNLKVKCFISGKITTLKEIENAGKRSADSLIRTFRDNNI